MTTETVEQATTPKEKAITPVEGTSLAKPPTSDKGKGAVSETKGELKYSEEDLSTHKKTWQSVKDKELKTIYEERDSLNTKIADLQKGLTEKKEEKNLFGQEEAEKAEWGDTPEIQDFQTARRTARKEYKEFQSQKTNLDTLLEATNKQVKNNELRELAIKFLIDEDKVKEVAELVKELVDAKDPETYLEKRKLEKRLEELDPRHTHKPDSAIPSAPGGIDFNTMTPKEKIEYGLSHPKTK